jgi:ABC-type multidrug transport system ATPase subunit
MRNGVGKSTTIRVLLGLMKATSSRAELFGSDPWHDAAQLHGRLASTRSWSGPSSAASATGERTG